MELSPTGTEWNACSFVYSNPYRNVYLWSCAGGDSIPLNAATVQGQPLLCLARVLCGAYSRAAFIRGAAFIQGNTYGILCT